MRKLVAIGGCDSVKIEIYSGQDGQLKWYGCPYRCPYEGTCFWNWGSYATSMREGRLETIDDLVGAWKRWDEIVAQRWKVTGEYGFIGIPPKPISPAE